MVPRPDGCGATRATCRSRPTTTVTAAPRISRPAPGVWWIVDGSTGPFTSVGLPGDIPVPGDYDGDGRTDIAIWRPATGVWWIISSSTGVGWVAAMGRGGTDWPVPGDYDGDGRTNIAIWRARTPRVVDHRQQHLDRSQLSPGATPATGLVPGDYDGDGRTDIVIWRAFHR